MLRFLKLAVMVGVVAIGARAAAQNLDLNKLREDVGTGKAASAAKEAMPEAQSFVKGILDRVEKEGAVPEAERWISRQSVPTAPSTSPATDRPVATESGVDLDALVSRGTAVATGQQPPRMPPLVVFVSSSMPKESLIAWSEQTRKAGGILVLRGMVGGSMKKTIDFVTAVAKTTKAGMSIDPVLFRAFEITKVPTVVVAAGDLGECQRIDCVPAIPPHDQISGNTTLYYALDQIASGNGPGATLASIYKAKLEAAP